MTLAKLENADLLPLLHTAYKHSTKFGGLFICVEAGGGVAVDKGFEIALIERTEHNVYLYNQAGMRVGRVAVNEYAITSLHPLLSDVDSIRILQKLRTWDNEVLASVLINEINRIFPRPAR